MALLGLRNLILLVAISSTAIAKDKKPAKGEVVTELGKGVMYVLQTKNNDYWFGSNDNGVYRFDGKTLVNFSTKDGLASKRIRGRLSAGPASSLSVYSFICTQFLNRLRLQG